MEEGDDWDAVEAVKTVFIAGIADKIRQQFQTQLQAAAALSIDQGMVSRLCSGKTERFSLPWLVEMADKLECDISVKVT